MVLNSRKGNDAILT